MKIAEFCLRPARSGEDVDREETNLDGRHSIPKEDSVLDSHGPELSVRSLRPVDRRMDHHRSSHGHDGLDRTFGNSIVMMDADSRIPNCLAELLKVLGESLRYEGRAIVEEIGLWNHTDVSSCKLEQFLRLEGLVGG
jgi:hypothetical protein